MTFDDDHFAYDGGMSQCISNFGRNGVNDIDEAYELQDLEDQDVVGRDKAEFYIGELVRWCRHFNGKSKKLEAALAQIDDAVASLFISAGGIEADRLVQESSDGWEDGWTMDKAIEHVRKFISAPVPAPTEGREGT